MISGPSVEVVGEGVGVELGNDEEVEVDGRIDEEVVEEEGAEWQ